MPFTCPDCKYNSYAVDMSAANGTRRCNGPGCIFGWLPEYDHLFITNTVAHSHETMNETTVREAMGDVLTKAIESLKQAKIAMCCNDTPKGSRPYPSDLDEVLEGVIDHVAGYNPEAPFHSVAIPHKSKIPSKPQWAPQDALSQHTMLTTIYTCSYIAIMASRAYKSLKVKLSKSTQNASDLLSRIDDLKKQWAKKEAEHTKFMYETRVNTDRLKNMVQVKCKAIAELTKRNSELELYVGSTEMNRRLDKAKEENIGLIKAINSMTCKLNELNIHKDKTDHELNVLRGYLAVLGTENGKLEATLSETRNRSVQLAMDCDKLQEFKNYVHTKLTNMGVPADPYPDNTFHTKCRIEGRLNYINENTVWKPGYPK